MLDVRRAAIRECLSEVAKHEERWFALEKDFAALNEREAAERARASRLACSGVYLALKKLL